MTFIVYSSARVRTVKSREARFINPSFFTGPEQDATAVYLNGDYPRIRAAYERVGVPVFDLRETKGLRKPLPAPEPPQKPRRTYRRKRKSA